MASYIQGNLAIDEKRKQKEKVIERKRVIYRRKSLPTQEKLLYLFTMVLCVIVAGVIIWRYAQIYEVNTKIQQIENEIHILENENKQLKLEVNKLQDPKRMIEAAKQLGLRPSGEGEIKEVPNGVNIAQGQTKEQESDKLAFNP